MWTAAKARRSVPEGAALFGLICVRRAEILPAHPLTMNLPAGS